MDVLAIGAHPDDVEIFAGATLAAWVRQGHRVHIVHLTRGELATRGNPDTRRDEAARAAQALGATMEILDLGDGRVRDDDPSRRAVVSRIRAHRPRMLVGPLALDDHPDHRATGALVEASWFLAGVARYEPDLGAPWRSAPPWFYPSHRLVEPSLLFAVEPNDMQAFDRAVRAYRSQLFDPDSSDPDTRLSDPGYVESLWARRRHFGSRAGTPFAEPFVVSGALPLSNLQSILP